MIKFLRETDVDEKAVFLRLDWNVPLLKGEIINDNRLKATLPTIEYLIKKNCRIIIGTHLGRPDGEVIPSLSTTILAKRLSKYIQNEVIATDLVIEQQVKNKISALEAGQIIVLGNLRWYGEEETNNMAFAHILSTYADVFVNDAFAVCHRAHASVEAITKFLPSYAGLLLEKEVETLKILTENPRQPLVLVLGGAKIKDKIGLILKFADRAHKVLVGGAIANTFRYFNGEDISSSFFEPEMEAKVKTIVSSLGDKLVLPIDQETKKMPGKKFSILDLGPESIAKFKKIISEAKTVFWNGNIGYTEDKQFETGTLKVAKSIQACPGTTIVAGGDTVGFLDSKNLISGFTFVSTGGGATLEFLAGEKLPALEALGYYEK